MISSRGVSKSYLYFLTFSCVSWSNK